MTRLLLLITALFSTIATVSAAEPERQVIPAKPEGRFVDEPAMQKVCEEIKTPFKYGVVLKGADTNELVDCPSVFRSGEHWYMMYVAITNKVGYQTFLASSDDLVHWTKLGLILPFSTNGWDAWQADGGIALADYRWDGTHELEKFDGKFWLSYIGGAKQGYETDPLSTGIAWTHDATRRENLASLGTKSGAYHLINPTCATLKKRRSTKARSFTTTSESLGWPFVMFYNGKLKNGFERIGMAVSRDMVNWSRYGTNPVVANGEAKTNGMSGDPQIVKIGDVWVMFYFGAGWQPKAFDTFACSYDLVHWTKWSGPNLIQPSEPFDHTYAHKPWVLKYKGVVYHFYCAVGTEGRVIALATSVDLKPGSAGVSPAGQVSNPSILKTQP